MSKNSPVVTRISAQQSKLLSEAALLDAQIKLLQKQLDEKKAKLDLPPGAYETASATLTIGSTERTSLDSAIVKALLTPAQLISATRTSNVTSYRFKLKNVVELNAA